MAIIKCVLGVDGGGASSSGGRSISELGLDPYELG